MTKFFDGRDYAQKKEKELKSEVILLKKSGVSPKMVSLIIGDDKGSFLYQNLKKKAAERVGAQVEILNFASDINKSEILKSIRKFNNDKSVNGIMIQLPLPKKYSKKVLTQLIEAITPKKDVDGLKKVSPLTSPVVRAIFDAIPVKNTDLKVAVAGAYGFEGKKIVAELKFRNYKKIFEIGRTSPNPELLLRQADIVVSATGHESLIKPDMIKKGAVLIDLGSPRGDVDKGCYEKASYVSPVPGGIGPATISNLIDNLVEAAGFQLNEP